MVVAGVADGAGLAEAHFGDAVGAVFVAAGEGFVVSVSSAGGAEVVAHGVGPGGGSGIAAGEFGSVVPHFFSVSDVPLGGGVSNSKREHYSSPLRCFAYSASLRGGNNRTQRYWPAKEHLGIPYREMV